MPVQRCTVPLNTSDVTQKYIGTGNGTVCRVIIYMSNQFFNPSTERRMFFLLKVRLCAALFLDSASFNSVARNGEHRLACVANSMAYVSRLVLGRFMFRGERTRLHGNALNSCVVMDTLPHFLLASTPF